MSNQTDNLWEEIKKTVRKIKTNRFVNEPKSAEIELRKNKATSVPFDLQKKGYAVAKDDFSQMDGSLARRFKKEEFKIEAILDLHGVVEKEAFVKVDNFIKSAYNNRKRIVLIITGKGHDDVLFSGKGVLKKAVPQWLSNSEISPLILGYKNPSESLGGQGALYIMLRKS